jgi:hypothetical protein
MLGLVTVQQPRAAGVFEDRVGTARDCRSRRFPSVPLRRHGQGQRGVAPGLIRFARNDDGGDAARRQTAIALDTNNYPAPSCVLSEPEAVNATTPSRGNP